MHIEPYNSEPVGYALELYDIGRMCIYLYIST
jgi:hypothetical protein